MGSTRSLGKGASPAGWRPSLLVTIKLSSNLGPQDLLLCRAPPSDPLKRFGLLRRLEGPAQARQGVVVIRDQTSY